MNHAAMPAGNETDVILLPTKSNQDINNKIRSGILFDVSGVDGRRWKLFSE